jgi:transcriptional regulator with XRE-family HTH domain
MEGVVRLAQNCAMFKKKRKKTYIREWRRFRSLTQEQLAERIGLSSAQLSRIESGVQEYRQDLLELIAEELRTDPASLIMRDPSLEGAPHSIWDTLSPIERAKAEPIITEVIRAIKATGTEG